MSYYIDQLAEQDRQKRLADLLAMQEQGYDYGPPMAEDAPPDDILPPPEYRGESMANTPPRQFLSDLASPQQMPPQMQQPQQEPIYGPGTVVKRMRDGSGKVHVFGPQQQPQQSTDPDMLIKDLMGKIAAMTQPGFKEAHPDPAYSSRVHTQGVQDIASRPEFKQLQAMFLLQKMQGEAGKAQREARGGDKESTYDKRMSELRAEEVAARQPGTQAYKRIQDEALAKRKEGVKNASTMTAAESSKRYSESVASEVDVAIAALFNTTPDKLPELFGSAEGMKKAEGQTEAATGSVDVYTPTVLQSTANVEERAKRLQSMAELMGLTNLRKAGVAPGSITEKEWPKFGAQLGNISLRMGDKEFADEMARIWRQNQQMRGTGQMDLEDAMKSVGGEQGAAVAAAPAQKRNLTTSDGDAMAWAMKNPNDPRAAAIKKRLGVR